MWKNKWVGVVGAAVATLAGAAAQAGPTPGCTAGGGGGSTECGAGSTLSADNSTAVRTLADDCHRSPGLRLRRRCHRDSLPRHWVPGAGH